MNKNEATNESKEMQVTDRRSPAQPENQHNRAKTWHKQLRKKNQARQDKNYQT